MRNLCNAAIFEVFTFFYLHRLISKSNYNLRPASLSIFFWENATKKFPFQQLSSNFQDLRNAQ